MSTIEKMTTEELEKALEKRKQQEADKREAAKAEYEKRRDELVQSMMKQATELHHKLKSFKDVIDYQMELQSDRLQEYGMMRSNSKGGFAIKNEEKGIRLARRRQVTPDWDERANKGEEILRDFFKDTVKKRDAKLAEILMSYLTKNKEGKLRYSSVMKLLQHKDKFKDERWHEALKLLQESYNTGFTKYYYEFQIQNEKTGDWESLSLNFNSL